MRNESDLPEGVINADPAGGRDENDDAESRERSAAAAEELDESRPVEDDRAGQGADPDLFLPDEEVR